MLKQEGNSSGLFSVWIKPSPSKDRLKFAIESESTGDVLYVKFTDQPRLVVFKPDTRSTQHLIKKIFGNLCVVEKILEGDAAVQDLLVLATPDNLPLYQTAEKEATKGGKTLCPQIAALLRSVTRLASNVECFSWSVESIDAGSMIKELVRNIHGSVQGLDVLAVGGGVFSQNILKSLIDAGLKHFTVVSKSEADAKQFAISHGGHFAGLERIELLLPDVDVVITDIGDGRVWILADDVKRALRRRRRKPLLIVDGGIPSDVAPSVDRIEDAYVFSIDDLERMAMEILGGEATEQKRDDLLKAEIQVMQEVISSYQIGDAFIKVSEKSPRWIKRRLAELSDADGILPLAVREAITLLFGNSSDQQLELDKKHRDSDAHL